VAACARVWAGAFFPQLRHIYVPSLTPPVSTHNSLHTCAVLCLLPYWSAALGVASPAVRVFAVAQLLAVPLLCAWSDTRGAARRRTALLLSCATSALAWLTLARATDPLALVAAAAALGASAGVAPLAYAHCGDVINAGSSGSNTGGAAVSPAWTAATLALAAGVGAALAPSLAARVAQAGGLGAAASAAAGVAALCGLLAVFVVRDAGGEQARSDDVDVDDDGDALQPGPGGAATHLLVVRSLLTAVMATVALAMGPRHSALFALPPPVSAQLGAAWTTAQLVTWATVAPAAVRLAQGPGMLQTACCAAAALCLAAWLAATSPSAVALPLAGLALAGALARTANDTLLMQATGSARRRSGAVFGLAWAAQEGVRLLLIPAALTALAPASPDGGAAVMLAVAAACAASVAGAAYQLARSRDAVEQVGLVLQVEPEAGWADDGDGEFADNVGSGRAMGAGKGISADVSDAGGEGQFTGTVVMRRPLATRLAAAPQGGEDSARQFADQLLAAEVQVSRTVLMARDAAAREDSGRRGGAAGETRL
jgi:hypothetical protein